MFVLSVLYDMSSGLLLHSQKNLKTELSCGVVVIEQVLTDSAFFHVTHEYFSSLMTGPVCTQSEL